MCAPIFEPFPISDGKKKLQREAALLRELWSLTRSTPGLGWWSRSKHLLVLPALGRYRCSTHCRSESRAAPTSSKPPGSKPPMRLPCCSTWPCTGPECRWHSRYLRYGIDTMSPHSINTELTLPGNDISQGAEYSYVISSLFHES